MIKKRAALLMLTLLAATCCLAAGSAHAQERPQERGAQTSAEVSADTADLSITATVTARELRFDEVPNPKVEFTGQPRRDTLWDAQRENLPRPVQPGVTYRDIGIRLKIVSVFADIDRIVAEALGEVPASDGPTPNEQPRVENGQPSPPALEAARPTATKPL